MSKDSSIKVFAENVGDTNPRPVNNIPVWIENVSAIGGGGGGDFDPTYMSAQIDDKLNKNAVGFYKDYYGTYYVSGISGKQLSAYRTYSAYTARNAYTAQIAYTAHNAKKAQTAYYDGNSNSLTDTYYSVQNLSSFVQNNSANWGGGTGPTGNNPTILFESHSYDDGQGTSHLEHYMSNTGSNTEYISFVEENENNPSPIHVNGIQYSYSQIYYPIWCVNIEIPSNYVLSYHQTFEGHNTNTAIIGSNSSISAYTFGGGWSIWGANAVNFNSINSNTETQILDANGMTLTIITNGSFSATGSTAYSATVNNVGGYPVETFISATLGGVGGSTVTSGDVLPPGPTGTGNTYALCWNDANGLFWDMR